jgi:hypothetical protein
MSLKRIARAKKWLTLIALGVLIPAGLGLAYFELRGAFSPEVTVLLPIVYVGLVVLSLRISSLGARNSISPEIGGKRVDVPNLGRALGYFLGSLIWIAVAVRLVPDTPLGATVLLVPFFAVLGVSVFFLAKSFSRRSSGS